MGGLPFTELIRQIVFDTFPIKWTEDLTGPRLDAWEMVCAMAEELRWCANFFYEEYGKTLQCIVEKILNVRNTRVIQHLIRNLWLQLCYEGHV